MVCSCYAKFHPNFYSQKRFIMLKVKEWVSLQGKLHLTNAKGLAKYFVLYRPHFRKLFMPSCKTVQVPWMNRKRAGPTNLNFFHCQRGEKASVGPRAEILKRSATFSMLWTTIWKLELCPAEKKRKKLGQENSFAEVQARGSLQNTVLLPQDARHSYRTFAGSLVMPL